MAAEDGGHGLLFMENEQYSLVDALPYIDTQLGSTEVAQQVKALIDEEMSHFEPRDYLSTLPEPELPFLASDTMVKEFARIEAGQPFTGIDTGRYKVEAPDGADGQDHEHWKKQADNLNMQLEYNRLRCTNLEMLDRWGNKAWIAHSCLVRATERILGNEANGLRAAREEVNKKRKLDQISCGNELRKLNNELESYMSDNGEVHRALWSLEGEVERLKRTARERGLQVPGEAAEVADTAAASENGSAKEKTDS
jgi:hypothetical protein